MTHNYSIIDGPTMHDIISDMMDGHETTLRITNGRILMLINVVEREDGSGVSFNLEGIIDNSSTKKVYVRTDGVGGPITTLVG